MVSNLVAPAWAGDDTPKYLQQVADNEGAHLAAALIGLVGALLLIPGLMGVIHLLRRRRVGVGQIGAALFAIGAVMSVGLFVFTVMDIAMVDVNADRTQMVALSDRAEESVAASVFFLLYVAGFVLGGILLALGLWKRRAAPVWVPILLLVASVLGVSETADQQLLAVISRSLLAVALGAIGMKLLSLTDEEWGRWQAPPDRPEPGEGATKRLALTIIAVCLAIISAGLVGQQRRAAARPPDGDAGAGDAGPGDPLRLRRQPAAATRGHGRPVHDRWPAARRFEPPTGRVHGSFAETKAPPRYVQQGSATFILGDGRIMVTGALNSRGRTDRTDTFAVVGGSGAYAGARGTVVSTARRKSQRFLFTFAG